VASRLAEKNYRPAIVMDVGPELSRGSCRSIPEFHITEALDACADLLIQHGGHEQAAGFTIRNGDLAEWKQRMFAIAEDRLGGLDLKPTITIDAELPLSDVDWALFETLSQLEPTGQANQPPVFLSRNVEVVSHRVVGHDGSHLQLQLAGQNGMAAPVLLPAIAFRQGSWAECLPERIDAVYSLSLNEWNGRKSLQMQVSDLRATEVLSS
jgi:single-stranded-DNA-specific exonuclease